MTPPDATSAMDAEFDTVAAWTAEAARALGPDHYVPAACRGSGGPGAIDWFLDRLELDPGSTLLDVGAGVGGPAGYARDRLGASALLVEPEPDACRAARSLFGFPVTQAEAGALPVRSASCPAVWCLGVLSTTSDQDRVLRELARVLTPTGRLGLLVYATTRPLTDQPEGNRFPRRADLAAMFDATGLRVLDRASLDDMPGTSPEWTARADEVHDRIAATHGDDDAWQVSVRQEQTMSRLVSDGGVVGELCLLTAN